jgi:hypothetical protein
MEKQSPVDLGQGLSEGGGGQRVQFARTPSVRGVGQIWIIKIYNNLERFLK